MHSCLFVRVTGKYERIDFKDILYVEALRNYCRIFTGTRSYMILCCLKSIEKALPADDFCRIHRSYLVAVDKIKAFDKQHVYLPGKQLPQGESFAGELLRRVIIIGGDSRYVTQSIREYEQPVLVN